MKVMHDEITNLSSVLRLETPEILQEEKTLSDTYSNVKKAITAQIRTICDLAKELFKTDLATATPEFLKLSSWNVLSNHSK